MNFGLPYQGSKSRIAQELIRLLPSAEHFYDIFAGGCAMTDVALRSGKYREYHANDISDSVTLFERAVQGKYADERRWISREDFNRLKDTDPYIRYCWSFGNNGVDYMYAKEIEPWKKVLHYARVYQDRGELLKFGIVSDGSSVDIIAHHEEYKRKYIKWWLSQQDYTSEDLDALMSKTKEDIYHEEEKLRQYLLDALADSGLTQAEVGKRLGTQMQSHYFGRSQWAFPTQEHYQKMQTFMPALTENYDELVGLHRLWQSRQSLQSLESLESLQSLQRLQSLQSLQSLERLESLQRLQRLQSLERLESLQRLEVTQGDYRDVNILPNSVIYCDPPYKGTVGYNGTDFDHEAFYKWALSQEQPIFISEYNMPEEFVCVWRKNLKRKFSAAKISECPEGLFVPKRQYKALSQYRQLQLF